MRNNLVVHPRPVTPDERHWAEAFQSLIRTLIGFYTASRQDARAMRLALRPYHNLPFAKRAIEAAQRYGQESLAILRARRTSRQRAPELPRSMALLRSALINGDIAAAASATASVRELADAHILGLASKTSPKPRNPYSKTWHWLMAGNETGVLHKFEKDEMERIANLDLDAHRFTFLPLPERKLHDYEFIAHWMLSLTTDTKPVEINGSDYRVWAEFEFASSEFEAAKTAAARYMRGGGGAIQHAIEAARLIEASPTLRAEHDRLKASVQVVYRGLGFSSDDEKVTSKDVVTEERRRGVVAASRWEEAAIRFAYMVGHLESRTARRSAYGYVLTYHLTPDAIVLCTELFGGSYAEFEVVIDTKRATLAGIQAV